MTKITLLSAMLLPHVTTFISLSSHFFPKNSLSVTAQIQELKAKWKDHMDMRTWNVTLSGT